MPWRGPEYKGEFPTLGWDLLQWTADNLPSPRDEDKQLALTDEQANFFLHWYRINPETERFIHTTACLVCGKGWGKSPFAAILNIVEFCADVVFDGWDSNGNPVGRPWGTGNLPYPWQQIAAVAEDQTENTYDPLFALLTARKGAIADNLDLDVNMTRVSFKGHRPGKIEPVTSRSGTRQGQPLTSATLDEMHLMFKHNGGKALRNVIRNNLTKMNGRLLGTANAYDTSQDSVCKDMEIRHLAGDETLLYHSPRYHIKPKDNWPDERLIKALNAAYPDSWWVDKVRILADAKVNEDGWEDSTRMFFNWPDSTKGRAVKAEEWDKLAAPHIHIPKPAHIGLGFDGSENKDSTILRAYARLEDSPQVHGFTLGEWTRPPDAPFTWMVPRKEVIDIIDATFKLHDVGMYFYDPHKWQDEHEYLTMRYGKDPATNKPRVVALWTNEKTKFAKMVKRWLTAINEGLFTHDDNKVIRAHVLAADKARISRDKNEDEARTLYILTKPDYKSKIDGAIADVLAYNASQVMPERVKKKKKKAAVFYA